ncbi:hypothetical protein NPIL_508441 [Nephila pilipes]|uniref:Uncharacterized protein n=1 Tax=Nephila pilipes TaxID=299642 RepID=A0A8X6NQT4_NEPPI|nr:hypothetical protein NPIL_508441 [Nephila pilipes]
MSGDILYQIFKQRLRNYFMFRVSSFSDLSCYSMAAQTFFMGLRSCEFRYQFIKWNLSTCSLTLFNMLWSVVLLGKLHFWWGRETPYLRNDVEIFYIFHMACSTPTNSTRDGHEKINPKL